MMDRVLVAVDDSGPALAAAEFAIGIARSRPIELNFVTVREPDRDADALLRHVETLATESGITVSTTVCDDGHPFDALLGVAASWQADLIVMGRSDMRRPGAPYVGSQTEHLLEFTDIPVLVVPSPPKKPR